MRWPSATGSRPGERDVFDLLVRGRSIDYIAQNLTISFNTAKSHIRHIYVKPTSTLARSSSTSSTASARCWALGSLRLDPLCP